MLTIPQNIGSPVLYESGLDSLESCLDKDHFKNYTKQVSYKFNSRGFRDVEWPDDLSNVIWCVGDSFTVGLGQPFEETWPQLLENKLNRRCLNLGQDRCSNDSMALRVNEIYKLYKPKLILIMWSYLWRRRIDGKDVLFNPGEHGQNFLNDIENFRKNVEKVCALDTKIIQTTICTALDYFESHPEYRQQKVFDHIIKPVPQLDYARDFHHFDVMTSEKFAQVFYDKIISHSIT